LQKLTNNSFKNVIKVQRKYRKEIDMTNEMTILSEGVILEDVEIEEMEEVVAPAIILTN
jgi:hypothetical protein